MVEGPPGWIDPADVQDLVEEGSIVIGPGKQLDYYVDRQIDPTDVQDLVEEG